MKKKWAVFAVVASSILLVSVFSYVCFVQNSAPDPFYVGVTYCGESVEEAEQLVDRVKDYTNLFVLQSGPLQNQRDNITAIGDYAVSSGMHFMVYFGSDSSWMMKLWLDKYDGHWNDKFLGVYFGDECGGRMLDGERLFHDEDTQSPLYKYADGSVSGYKVNGNESINMKYWQDGRIRLDITETNDEPAFTDEGELNPNYAYKITSVYYYPNGTVTAEMNDISNITLDTGNNTRQWQQVIENYNATFTYEELWNVRPFQSYDETAQRFSKESDFAMSRHGPQNFSYFTSDYAIYWYDYKAGYDVVLAQVGWNHTLAQDIALVRGAANLQNKSWGTIITWKYNHPPYLDNGEAIYEQMKTSYEAGAKYVVVFNYAEDMTGPYGTLQDEHFDALERFWSDVVESSAVKHGSTKSRAVLVLPKNYGWGMRDVEDKIWGLWGPDENLQQIWNLKQRLLDQYGYSLDIVYDDPEFSVDWKYDEVVYWDQTAHD